MTFFGVLLLAVIAFAGWSANQTATLSERQLLHNAFNQSIAGVLDGQKSVAWWDDAVLKVTEEGMDLEFTDANFGIFLTETYGHDEVYILNGDNAPIYAFVTDKRVEPEAYNKRKGALEAVVAEARGEAHASPLAARADEFGEAQTNYRVLAGAVQTARWAGHIISVEGRPAVVTAITIVPNVDMAVLKDVPKLLVSVVYIDEEFVKKLSRSLLLPDLALSEAPRTASGVVSEDFVGDDGVRSGFLSWTTRRPGQILLAIVLPLVACGVIATGVLSNHMLRRLKRASGELAQREARSRHAAKHDALSGLPNRQYMVEELEARLGGSGLSQGKVSAIAAYVDVDRFKDINDTLGHETGDKLIRAVSKRLSQRLRADDFLARFGGDEFAILCVSADKDAEAALAARVAAAFQDPFSIDGQMISVSASVGLAKAPEHGRTADELMRHADIALYEAKNLGRDRAVSFSQEMGRLVETRRAIEVDLRAALEKEELQVHYQPLVSCRTGAIVGAEALMRWRHPERGNISPGVFIPIAELTGLMPALGEWLIDRVMKDAQQWPDLEISLNLSPVQFKQGDLPDLLKRLSRKHDVAPERFVLEITEGVLLEATDETKSVLHDLKAMGFKTALDDFGTGYSSLAYLCNFEFDKIKIDRSFVSNVSNAPASRTIVQAVVSLGRGLGMRIVAEGVETEAEALIMSHFGCTELQGFLFSKPVEASELGALIETYRSRDLVNGADPIARAIGCGATA